jgi:hypothetical protein
MTSRRIFAALALLCAIAVPAHADLWPTPQAFGAKCDGVTNDATSLQAALNSLSPNGGGILYTPAGSVCLFDSTLTIPTNAVTLRGLNNKGEDIPTPSTWIYTGTGTPPAIDARDTGGFRIEGMQIVYSSTSFTGSLIDVSSLAPGSSVTFTPTIYNSHLGTSTLRTGTATLVNAGGTVDLTLDSVFFFHGAPAIVGQAILGQNVRTTIKGSFFAASDTVPINGCGQSWVVEGNSFEPLNSGRAGALIVTNGGLYCAAMTWTGNWHGDVSLTGGTWIDGYFQGMNVTGNEVAGLGTIGGTGITLRGPSGGVNIDGNRFELLDTAVNVATAGTGLRMGQNTYSNVTTRVTNASNVTAGDFTLGGNGLTTISPQAVTFAKIQGMTTATLLGNPLGPTSSPQEIPLGNTFIIGPPFPGQLQTGAITGDVTAPTNSFVTTLATVNATPGTFGSATSCVTVTNNAKGLTTGISAATCTPAIGSVTGLGTSVATALGVNIGTAGSVVVNGGALGSPSSVGTLPAHTLGGTVSGAGNTISNVILAPKTAFSSGVAQIDYSGQTTNTLANGGTATLCASTLYGKILISEFTSVGDTAEYLIVGIGSIVLQASVTGGFVAPTSTPAAGKMSIYISGGNVILVNNSGVTIGYRVALTKL